MQARKIVNNWIVEELTHKEIDIKEFKSDDEEYENTRDLMAITVHALATPTRK